MGTAESAVRVKLVAAPVSRAWLRAVTGLAPSASVGVARVYVRVAPAPEPVKPASAGKL